MVREAPKQQEPQEKGIKLIHPTKIEELRQSPYKRFIIKYSLQACPPCRAMEKWLNEYQTEKFIPIYSIKDTEEQNPLLKQMGAIHNVSSVPKLVVCETGLCVVDSMVGFNEDKLEDLFEKHFSY